MKTKVLFLKFLLLTLCEGGVIPSRGGQCQSELPPDPSSGCCGIDVTTSNRVVGGEPTSLLQYPWMGMMEYTHRFTGARGGYLCGSFLISSRYVITAAHCVLRLGDWLPSGVRLGEFDKTTYFDCDGSSCIVSTSIAIENFVVHDDYITYKDEDTRQLVVQNDIALIMLAEPAPYTDEIRPICLPDTDVTVKPPPRLNLTVAGWGIMDQMWSEDKFDYLYNLSSTKRHASLRYWPYEDCRRVDGNVTPQHLCAGGDGAATCGGDSGGPAMYNRDEVYEAVGIVSYGPIHCTSTYPRTFTKVFNYKNWIMEKIHDYESEEMEEPQETEDSE